MNEGFDTKIKDDLTYMAGQHTSQFDRQNEAGVSQRTCAVCYAAGGVGIYSMATKESHASRCAWVGMLVESMSKSEDKTGNVRELFAV